jgi:hypothetical protein
MAVEAHQRNPDGTVEWTTQQKEFIFQEYDRCYESGYWLYIRGVLTWLTPWQYMGLNYWRPALETEDGFMEYRNRQRKILHFCWNVFKNQKEFGVVYLKGRQEGLSTWAHLIMYWLASNKSNQIVGLSASDLALAESNFDELMAKPIENLPLWLLPTLRVNKGEILFREPKENISKNKMVKSMSGALNSKLELVALTPRGWDGKRLNGLFADEGGKWTRVNVNKWWSKQIPALRINGRKRGFAFFPSTNEEGDKGGLEFQKLFLQADVSTRGDGKYPHTTNQLISLFIDTAEGYPGWIDKYGNDIVDYPDDEQWQDMQENGHTERIGSRDYLVRYRQQLLESGDDEAYAEQLRQNPFNPTDAFNSMNEHCPFDVTILQNLKKNASARDVQDRIMRGYFSPIDPNDFSKGAKWNHSIKGPIARTWEPHPDFINVLKVSRGEYHPANLSLGAFGLDPYLKAIVKTKGSKMAFSGKLFFNEKYERDNWMYRMERGENKPDYFPTPAIFLHFCHRSEMQQDLDQLLLAAIYYSMPIAAENNTLIATENYFKQKGFGGFLLNEADIECSISPSEKMFMQKGVTTGAENQGNDVVRKGATYLNDFLRGNSLYLGQHTYEIQNTPLRYPFMDAIDDNMNFDIHNRTKSDTTMSQVMVHYYEFNKNDYSSPIGAKIRGGASVGARLMPSGVFVRKIRN